MPGTRGASRSQAGAAAMVPVTAKVLPATLARPRDVAVAVDCPGTWGSSRRSMPARARAARAGSRPAAGSVVQAPAGPGPAPTPAPGFSAFTIAPAPRATPHHQRDGERRGIDVARRTPCAARCLRGCGDGVEQVGGDALAVVLVRGEVRHPDRQAGPCANGATWPGSRRSRWRSRRSRSRPRSRRRTSRPGRPRRSRHPP